MARVAATWFDNSVYDGPSLIVNEAGFNAPIPESDRLVNVGGITSVFACSRGEHWAAEMRLRSLPKRAARLKKHPFEIEFL